MGPSSTKNKTSIFSQIKIRFAHSGVGMATFVWECV